MSSSQVGSGCEIWWSSSIFISNIHPYPIPLRTHRFGPWHQVGSDMSDFDDQEAVTFTWTWTWTWTWNHLIFHDHGFMDWVFSIHSVLESYYAQCQPLSIRIYPLGYTKDWIESKKVCNMTYQMNLLPRWRKWQRYSYFQLQTTKEMGSVQSKPASRTNQTNQKSKPYQKLLQQYIEWTSSKVFTCIIAKYRGAITCLKNGLMGSFDMEA